MLIKIIYTLFLALIVALFVGLGIDAFYPGPKAPEYPIELEKPYETGHQETEQEEQARLEYFEKQKQFQEESKVYNRNVSIIAIIFAIAILVVSLTFLAKIKMIADGILLGGVFTTVYAIIRGLMSEDSKFRFLVVTVGLVIALFLGYLKFVKNKKLITELKK
jgi:uncharacterized membrane protein